MRPGETLVRKARGVVEPYTAWPTKVAGLVIIEAKGNDWNCVWPRRSWQLVHVRSGLCIATCFDSPEGALHIAETMGAVCDFTRSALEVTADAIEIADVLLNRDVHLHGRKTHDMSDL